MKLDVRENGDLWEVVSESGQVWQRLQTRPEAVRVAEEMSGKPREWWETGLDR
jgi:hypothetical protein